MGSLNAPYAIKAACFCTEPPAAIPRGVFPCAPPRRLSNLSKACLTCVTQLIAEQGDAILQLPVVYASRHGELERTHSLFDEWAEYGEMSPAGFSLSVHNATASLLGLASHNQNNSTTLAAGEDSLAMGVLEASMFCRNGGDCLLVYGDTYPGLNAAALLISAGDNRPLPSTFTGLQALWNTSSRP